MFFPLIIHINKMRNYFNIKNMKEIKDEMNEMIDKTYPIIQEKIFLSLSERMKKLENQFNELKKELTGKNSEINKLRSTIKETNNKLMNKN